MKKLITLIFSLYIILALTPIAFSEKISESTFSELGYETIIADTIQCQEYEFVADVPKKEEYFVVSLHTEFLPIKDSEANIGVSLNDQKIGGYFSKDFLNDWLRLKIDKSRLHEENLLKVCLKPSESAVKVVLHKDSMFGTYLLPDFSAEGAFTKELSDNEPFVGEEFEVFINLKNYGSENAVLQSGHSKEKIEEIFPYLKVVRGNLWKAITIEKCRTYLEDACVEPGETSTSYIMKSEKAINLLLFAATASYTNEFGEEITIESNRTFLNVRKPELEIIATLYSQDNEMKINESKEITLRLENNSPYSAYNLEANLFADNLSLSLETISIEKIEPNSSKELVFSVSSLESGKAEINCEIIGQDYNKSASCETIEILVKGEEDYSWLVSVGALVLVSVAVYFYILSKK